MSEQLYSFEGEMKSLSEIESIKESRADSKDFIKESKKEVKSKAKKEVKPKAKK